MNSRASAFLVSFTAFSLCSGYARADALAKFKLDKLEAVHKAIQALRSERREVPRSGPHKEYRANLHVHSLLSHDSRGTTEELVAAARKTGTPVLKITDHPPGPHPYC